MGLILDVGQSTHPGHERETNEDNLCVLVRPQVVEDFDALLVVADGMGGHRAGEIASQYVAETLRDLFTSVKYRSWVAFSPDREDYTILVLKEVLERLNSELYQMAARRDEFRGMGTTITAALVVGDKLYIGHVGDSRAYLLSNKTFRQITKDHSWVMEQVEQGALTLDQAAVHPRKNEITRALGVSNLVRVDRLIESFQPGDVVLLCSDGLSNMVSDAEMAWVLQANPHAQMACNALVDLANQHGGADNITVVVARALTSGQKVPVANSTPSAQAGSFEISDTQPLGPIIQSTGRQKKSGEPVRIAPPVQPVTPPTLPESVEPAAVTQELESSVAAENPARQSMPPALSVSDDVQTSPVVSNTLTDQTSELRQPLSPSQSSARFFSIVQVIGFIGLAFLAAMVNGAIVYVCLSLEPPMSKEIVAGLVLSFTLLFALFAMIANALVTALQAR